MIGRNEIILFFLNILNAIGVSFLSVIIFTIIHFGYFEVINDRTFLSTIIMFIVCVFPQIIYRMIIFLLEKKFKLKLNLILYNIFSIVVSIVSLVVLILFSLQQSGTKIISPKIEILKYFYGFFLTMIISGLLFINFSYIIKKVFEKK
jgi:hypothetical protein